MNAPADKSIKTFHGGCPHDCLDACTMQYHLQDGKLLKVTANNEHP